jgi:hypothetical protein
MSGRLLQIPAIPDRPPHSSPHPIGRRLGGIAAVDPRRFGFAAFLRSDELERFLHGSA